MASRCLPACAILLMAVTRATAWLPSAGRALARQPPLRMVASKPGGPKAKFQPPEPRPFYVRPDRLLDVVGASAVAVLRAGSGAFVLGWGVKFEDPANVDPTRYTFPLEVGGKRAVESSASFVNRPKKPVVIYEFQGCPFCAKVRDAVSILDLDVLFLPTPKDGVKWRPEAVQKGGKAQFPYMADPNTGVAMYESDEIIKYLFGTYGDGTGEVPKTLTLGYLTTLSVGLALAPRIGKGSKASPSKVPPKPLEFWGYEASPFSRVVREVLCELELPFVQRSCARGSSKRDEFFKRTGRFQVPYIEDPNTGVKMFESAEIMEYLRSTYSKQ